MATLTEQLDALKAARASGEKSVSYNGKRVEYRDMAELQQAISAVQAELDAESSTPRTRSGLAYFNRGFN